MTPSNNDDQATPVLSLPAEIKDNHRYVELQKLFIEKYCSDPEYFVRVPGRVNLIGEHVDYCGYSVCPMAIQQDIVIAVKAAKDSTIMLTNTDKKHEDYTTDINNFSIEVKNGEPPKWHNYVLCGIKGVMETTPESHASIGFFAAVTGNIPLASGLSSSSALVCAAALATVHVNKLSFSKKNLADLCAQSERYIGTQGGGMDQAIAFLATAGSAKHIEFEPLRATQVELPQDAVFVIAHCLHSLNKAATGDFNQRVAECRLASQLIAKRKGLPWRDLGKLAALQLALKASLPEMECLVSDILHREPYTKLEVCKELEISEEELESTSLGPRVKNVTSFKLHQRALHVFQEASRVLQFCKVCREKEGPEALLQLGELLKSSHQSLSNLYECSHPQLDRLVEVANKKALGCRLTGAGWGGCTVSLATSSTAKELVDLLKSEFYQGNSDLKCHQNLKDLAFITSPGCGAQIFIAPKLM